MSDQVNILLVDDQPGKLLSYEVMLRDLNENLIKASNANEALQALLRHDVAVILIDVCMPELDGFELAAMIRQHPRYQKTALIFISAIHLSESDYLRGYDAGAVDYVPVPVVPELLRAKVRVFAELYRKTKQLESLNRELEQRVAERTAALETAHDRLVQSEGARSLALAAGQMGSWEFDAGIDSWSCDAGLRQIFGVGEDFLPNHETIKPRIHVEDYQQFKASMSALSVQNNTFQSEIRVVRDDGEIRWCLATTAASMKPDGSLEGLSGVLVDITGRKEAETMQILLAREVDHRARNALGVVQAIVRLARADTIDGYIRAVDGRIQALAHTHELLSKSRWQGADIERLISEELAPYRETNAGKVTLDGPSVILAPERAQAIGIVLHELATNAAKYGALSCEEGKLDVRWTNSGGVLTLDWTELGCSGITAPTRRGFGTKIITSSLHQGNGGEARFDWQPTGLRFTLTLNSERKQAASKPGVPAAAQMPAPAKSKRVLVVEDESLIGMLTMDMVKELGYATLGPMTNIADAAEVIERAQFDIAVIDLNLNGKPAYPLAEALDKKGVPFVFVTGYAPDSIDERFSHVPLIQKPIPREALAKSLRQQLGAQRRISAVTG